MISLTQDPIDVRSCTQHVNVPEAGAIVFFLGTTRGLTDGRATRSLDYECYAEMAERKLSELERRARERWPLLEVLIVHRLGHLQPGEASVAVAVSTAHRGPAFEAAKWLIDTIKEDVPIWKKENWADGTSQWVHPGINAPLESPTEDSERESPN
jgi:molybdopterin synthase catalytic subunit